MAREIFHQGDRVMLFATENSPSGVVTYASRHAYPGEQNVEVAFDDGSGYHGDSGGIQHVPAQD